MARRKTEPLKSKLTDEAIASIAASVEIGLPYSTACELEGFFEYAHRGWAETGKKDLALGIDSQFARLVDAVTRARARFRSQCIRALRRGMDSEDAKEAWKAALAVLERTDPQWMKKEHVQTDSTHTETKTYVVVTNVPGRVNSRTEMPRLTFADKHPAVVKHAGN